MYSVEKPEFNEILLGMTERITTGFSLPATKPNPRNKERKRKAKLPKQTKANQFPLHFYQLNALIIFLGILGISEVGLKLPILEDFSY